MISRRRISWVVALLLVTGSCAGARFARTTLLVGLGHWLDVGALPPRVDYVMLLPGDSNSRPFVAAALYRAKLGQQIVTPQTVISPAVRDGSVLSDNEVARRVLRLRGVPEEHIIVLAGESQSTFDDAQALREYLRKRPASSIAVVTSDFHTRRSRWTFRQVFDGTPHRLYFVSAPTDDYHAGNWWQVQSGVMNYSSEFAKLPYYWFYYHPAGVWIAAIVLLTVPATVVWRRRRVLPEVRSSHA